MPVLDLGTWGLDGKECYNAVNWALMAGYRHIDTAQGYKNEPEVGRVIKDSGVPRHEIVLTTKLTQPDSFGAKATPLQLDKQLRVLQVEYLDLYMLHGPHEEDPALEMEAWKALEDAQRAGKVRSIGVSNFEAWQLEHLLGYASIKPATVQNKFDVFAPVALRCFSGTMQLLALGVFIL